VGEDGPTHQPIEHLAALRAIPELIVIRPADATEVVEAWKVAINRRNGPTVLVLTRQNLPILDRQKFNGADGVSRGAYVLADYSEGNPDLILIASGSEVALISEAAEVLAKEDIKVRVVSFPSWRLFEAQTKKYQDSVLTPSCTKRLVVEAGVKQGWGRWVGSECNAISIERFGSSAPGRVVFEKYGFTVSNVIEKSKELLQTKK
jgi:transketolase